MSHMKNFGMTLSYKTGHNGVITDQVAEEGTEMLKTMTSEEISEFLSDPIPITLDEKCEKECEYFGQPHRCRKCAHYTDQLIKYNK